MPFIQNKDKLFYFFILYSCFLSVLTNTNFWVKTWVWTHDCILLPSVNVISYYCTLMQSLIYVSGSRLKPGYWVINVSMTPWCCLLEQPKVWEKERINNLKLKHLILHCNKKATTICTSDPFQIITSNIHAFLFLPLSWAGLWGQQSQWRCPELPLQGCFLQFFRGNPQGGPGPVKRKSWPKVRVGT